MDRRRSRSWSPRRPDNYKRDYNEERLVDRRDERKDRHEQRNERYERRDYGRRDDICERRDARRDYDRRDDRRGSRCDDRDGYRSNEPKLEATESFDKLCRLEERKARDAEDEKEYSKSYKTQKSSTVSTADIRWDDPARLFVEVIKEYPHIFINYL